MKASGQLFGVLLILVLLGGFSSVYTVHQGQQGLLQRLGKLERTANGEVEVMQPGLHYKFPILNKAWLFDTRLQTLEVEQSRVVISGMQVVMVDYYAKWRIKNVEQFFLRTGGDFIRAETLLRQKLDGSLRAEFGKRTLQEVVTSERGSIMQLLRKQANISAAKIGVDVTDVRINRIDLPPQLSSRVFEQMRSDRKKTAIKYRAEGESESKVIRAKADATVTVTIAKANQQTQEIRGKGDATAAKIYADAYNKNADFYAFYRSLEAYRNTFNSKNDIMVLKPDGQFFKYFNGEARNKN